MAIFADINTKTYIESNKLKTNLSYLWIPRAEHVSIHPTGDVSPSKYDINTTKEVMEAGKLMKIELCDHIIVGTDGYYSFRAGKLI